MLENVRSEASLAVILGRCLLWGGLLVGVAAFGLHAAGWANFAFWAPKMEQVRHTTFKQSQAYQDGATKNLARLRLAYETADEAHRAALRLVILTEASVVDRETLPSELQTFIARLER